MISPDYLGNQRTLWPLPGRRLPLSAQDSSWSRCPRNRMIRTIAGVAIDVVSLLVRTGSRQLLPERDVPFPPGHKHLDQVRWKVRRGFTFYRSPFRRVMQTSFR